MHTAFALAFLVVSCASAPMAHDPRVRQAGQAMQELSARGFAGSVLVACGDDIVFAGDYGVSDSQERAPSYWLASISKQFTAAAILTLVEAGRVSLDDPVSRYFPEAPADKATITLQQLLTHQSGLPQAYASDGITDRDAAARAILATPLASSPGSRFSYSSDNYSLLAMVVEIASGVPFEDYVRQRLFTPAGLQDAGFWPDSGEDFTPPMLRIPSGVEHANWGYRGGTGMRASVRDLHAWSRALDTSRVLTTESRALLYGPHTSAGDGDGVGFGWFWSDLPSGRWLWTRGTEDYGPNAILYRRAGTRLVIIAATNAGPEEASGPGWSRRARDALMPIFDASSCESD